MHYFSEIGWAYVILCVRACACVYVHLRVCVCLHACVCGWVGVGVK